MTTRTYTEKKQDAVTTFVTTYTDDQNHFLWTVSFFPPSRFVIAGSEEVVPGVIRAHYPKIADYLFLGHTGNAEGYRLLLKGYGFTEKTTA